MRTTRNCFLLVAALALGLQGCSDDDKIRHYQVARPEPKPLNRLLGAIFPQGDHALFFKLVGPETLVKEHAAEFERFIGTVRLGDKAEQPPTWTVPAGWHQGPQNPARVATFSLGPRDAIELTIVSAGGSVIANVNRWRKQLELEEMTDDELEKSAGRSTVNGVPVTLVDMTGTGSGKTKMGGPFMGGGSNPPARAPVPPPEPPPGMPRFNAPATWKEVPPKGMRAAAFEVSDGGQQAEVVVIPLAGSGGGLLDNVNIWRGQIGLEATTAEQLNKDVRAPSTSPAVPPSMWTSPTRRGGRPAQRSLVVAAPNGGRTWFFKMSGPADLVGKQQLAFEAFVRSVQFDGGKGTKP